MAEKEKTIKKPIIISLIISIAIIILILYLTFDRNTFKYLSQVKIRYEFFFVALIFNIIYWFIWGARLRTLSNSITDETKISLWESTKIVIANLFLGAITPSMAGGEPVRIHLLNKDGLSLGSATAAVLGERLLDAIFLLICFPFAFFIFKDLIDIEVLNLALTVAVGFFVAAIALFAYTIKYPDKTKSFIIFISKKLSKLTKKKSIDSKLIRKINNEVDNFHEGMVFYLSKGKLAFLKAGVLTVLLWSTGFMIPSLILLGLGLQPYIILSYAAQIILIIIVMLPTTPGSSGVTELGMAGLFGIIIGASLTSAGHPILNYLNYDQALIALTGVFVLLFRFISYHMNLIAGAIFQYRIFKSVASFSLERIKK